MAKRFTDTNKYKKPFIRGLQGAYKLLWDYLYHDCDHAGIWIVDFDIAQIYIGLDMLVNKEDALKYFNSDEERIIEFNEGKKWFIPSFIEFQYGELNENNRAHNSVILILKKNNLYKNNKGLIRPLQGCKDKDKDKDKDMVKDKDIFFEKFKKITGKKIRIFDDKSERQFNARIKEGYTIDELIQATENCMNDDYHKENPKYLTLEFITRPDKLQKYINVDKIHSSINGNTVNSSVIIPGKKPTTGYDE